MDPDKRVPLPRKRWQPDAKRIVYTVNEYTMLPTLLCYGDDFAWGAPLFLTTRETHKADSATTPLRWKSGVTR